MAIGDRLDTLTQEWAAAKAAEKQATERRLMIESEIIGIVGDELPDKGTRTFGLLKIECRATEKWSQEGLAAALKRWTKKLSGGLEFPFRQEWKPETADLRYIQEHNPEAWDLLQSALTVTPNKPSFSVMTKKDLKSR